jgi:hypothetical protein
VHPDLGDAHCMGCLMLFHLHSRPLLSLKGGICKLCYCAGCCSPLAVLAHLLMRTCEAGVTQLQTWYQPLTQVPCYTSLSN